MHEFSVAENIVEIAVDTALANNANTILELEIDMGELSGVVYDALESALDIAVQGTLAENAAISIHRIKAEALCRNCGQRFSPEDPISPCTNCGSFVIDIIRGKELRIKSINIE